MKNKLKAAAAAVTAFALLGGALPVNFAGVELLRPAVTAKAADQTWYDENMLTLHLKGDIIHMYSPVISSCGIRLPDNVDSREDVEHIVAEEGTVFPVDCGDMFRNFTNLADADFSKADTSQTHYMRNMFDGCINMTKLNVSGFDTSNVTDMDEMFKNCKQLIKLDISNFDVSKVWYMRQMFYGCENLQEINLNGVNPREGGFSGLFRNCKSLTVLDLSSFDTSQITIMSNMFEGCESLKTIYVSDKWTTENLIEWMENEPGFDPITGINDTFKGCTSLIGGNGTAYDPEKTDAYMGCIDTAEHPGYLTGKQNKARGASITLAGELAVNFFLELHPDTAQIKVTGPENSVVPTGAYTIDASLFPNVYGKPREATVSYPINATQAGEPITLEFLDSSGNPLPVYNSDGVRFADDKLTYSAQQYIDDTPLYSDNAKLKALVGSLDNYCRAAHNFFFHKNDPVYGIEDVTIAQFEPYNYPLYGTEIALILNSKIEARIYSDNVIPEPFNGDGYLPTLFGTDQGYYFIYDIGAPQLASTETYQIGDTAFKFSPLTYGYYIMKKSDDESLKTLVRALYVYAQAAQAYPNGTD